MRKFATILFAYLVGPVFTFLLLGATVANAQSPDIKEVIAASQAVPSIVLTRNSTLHVDGAEIAYHTATLAIPGQATGLNVTAEIGASIGYQIVDNGEFQNETLHNADLTKNLQYSISHWYGGNLRVTYIDSNDAGHVLTTRVVVQSKGAR